MSNLGATVGVVDRDATIAASFLSYRANLLRKGRQWLSDASVVDDAVQETFRRFVIRSRGEHIDSPRAWLISTLRNVCHEFNRHRHPLILWCKDDDAIDDQEPAQTMIQAEDIERMLHALHQLPSEMREVIQMNYGIMLNGSSQSTLQISKSLGISLGTVKSRRHRALKQLRDMLNVRASGSEENCK